MKLVCSFKVYNKVYFLSLLFYFNFKMKKENNSLLTSPIILDINALLSKYDKWCYCLKSFNENCLSSPKDVMPRFEKFSTFQTKKVKSNRISVITNALWSNKNSHRYSYRHLRYIFLISCYLDNFLNHFDKWHR